VGVTLGFCKSTNKNQFFTVCGSYGRNMGAATQPPVPYLLFWLNNCASKRADDYLFIGVFLPWVIRWLIGIFSNWMPHGSSVKCSGVRFRLLVGNAMTSASDFRAALLRVILSCCVFTYLAIICVRIPRHPRYT
jgi:hypothetical protein